MLGGGPVYASQWTTLRQYTSYTPLVLFFTIKFRKVPPLLPPFLRHTRATVYLVPRVFHAPEAGRVLLPPVAPLETHVVHFHTQQRIHSNRSASTT